MALFEVDLAGDRKIWASSMLIRSTYSGMLEGYPIARINDGILERLKGEVTRALGDWPVHVIDPPRVLKRAEPRGPFGPEERLPACWMAAAFDSCTIDDAMHASSAILVWFQDDPFPCPSETALSRLRDVAWETIARDFEY